MARTNNLTNFLTDVAAAIKEKKGSLTAIPAANFDTEILALPSQGVYQTKTVPINTNGTITVTPDQGYDAIEQLTITTNVPVNRLQTKAYTFNANTTTTLTPETGYEGFSEIDLTIDVAGENLDSVITAQENKLDALEEILENKISGSAKPNIFVQDNEPNKKQGVWLKMSNTTAEHYVSDPDVYTGGNWSTDSYTDTPVAFGGYRRAVTVGDTIYFFNGTTAYKYNTTTNVYTQLATIPGNFGGGAAGVGTDIYLFGIGDSSSSRSAYKYNTLNDTYEAITNIPYDFRGGGAAAIDTNIYLVGSTFSTSRTYTYKYNTSTGEYTKLQNISYMSEYGTKNVISAKGNIYVIDMFAGCKKYNISTNTWSDIANYSFSQGSAAALGNYIYVFGDYNDRTLDKKYDISTNTWSSMTRIPYSYYSGNIGTANGKIYLFGGSAYPNKVQAYVAAAKSYSTDNTVVLQAGNTYSTELYETNFEEGYKPVYKLDDAFFYTEQDGLDGTMPVYYGNGTTWINIKNPVNQGGGN